LSTYAFPVIGETRLDRVTTEQILQILKPIWNEKRETARRVRSRVENILDYAAAHGHRAGANPARWKGHLDKLLPAKGARVVHHAAMPYADVPAFMARLAGREALSARALKFLILSAARVGEVIGATWDEIDLEARTWAVPPERYKTRKGHRVPLSDAAVALLEGLPTREGYLFSVGRPVSNMAMAQLLWPHSLNSRLKSSRMV